LHAHASEVLLPAEPYHEISGSLVVMAQAIMRTLLGYIGKEKHADSLVEKLMLRFEAAAEPSQWRNLAFCLAQVRAPSLAIGPTAAMGPFGTH
jgi:hypothetical protein